MINFVLPRMACRCAILAIALAHCGCQSMKGPSGWASAWQSKPASQNPNDRTSERYWGQKRNEPKLDPDELARRMPGVQEASRPQAFETHLQQGNLALRDNRLADAKREYEKGLKLRPDDADCHHRLAVVADNERQFGAADDHYEEAKKKRPHDPNLLSDIGYSYSLRGDDRRAEATLKEALAISASHKGAMGNLGTIYSKQGRYEEAVAMFRRGASETEAQQYLAQLFPQRSPSGPGASGTDAVAQVANTNAPRSTPPPAGNERPDYSKMTAEQVRALMDQKKYDAQQQRQQQWTEPPRRDWTNDHGQQQPPSSQQQNQPLVFGGTESVASAQQRLISQQQNQTLVFGAGGNQPPANQFAPSNQLPAFVPNSVGGSPMNPGSNPGFANGGGYQGGTNSVGGQGFSNGGQGFPPNGSANSFADGSLTAQPGTNPKIDVWNGAGLQPAGGLQSNPYGRRSDTSNTPYQTRPFGQSSQQFGSSQPSSYNSYGRNRSLPGVPDPQSSFGSGNTSFGAGNANSPDSSVNLAAAQLGMNAGPGGMFPVVQTDAASPSAFGSQGQSPPAIDSRFGAEFPSAPTYQNPGFQTQPSRSSFTPGDPRQGANSAPSRSSFGGFNDGDSLAPSSPGSNWPVIQAGGTTAPMNPSGSQYSSSQYSSSQFNEPPLRSSSESTSAWADKPSLGGTAPFSGAWPPGSQSTTPASTNTFGSNNTFGGTSNNGTNNNGTSTNGYSNNSYNNNGAVPNSIPMWNGGPSNTRPQQPQFGPAMSNPSANAPEQWPHSQPR